ncbi:four helix bundle protein [Niabella sp. CC-SYL272]|uniref:four helix bundle protein n=1 Tax=Niabella agricola TaxID=2891571 RepID=UPI001F2AB1C6|nr:four helix bundle protein [Niabella agricola]MCF3110098.1 four helix bundle protein [Niabella agricola]
MGTVSRFEDLEIWKLARELSKMIYSFTLRESFSKDYKLKDQIRGASGSAMDNIAEGFEKGSRLEFVNFLSFAKGSCGEVKSQLYRALDQEYIAEGEQIEAYNQYNKLSAGISNFISYLNQSAIRGSKFKGRTGG